MGVKIESYVQDGRLKVNIDLQLRGDLHGHPFRGNQWGGGTSDMAEIEETVDWKGDRGPFAREGIRMLQEAKSDGDLGREKNVLGVIKRDSAGVLKGVMACDNSDEKTIELFYFATAETGHGKEMMLQLAKEAAMQGKGIRLCSTKSAMGFYERLGMTPEKDEHFSWTAEQCLSLTEKKEYSDEPLDGVFTQFKGGRYETKDEEN